MPPALSPENSRPFQSCTLGEAPQIGPSVNGTNNRIPVTEHSQGRPERCSNHGSSWKEIGLVADNKLDISILLAKPTLQSTEFASIFAEQESRRSSISTRPKAFLPFGPQTLAYSPKANPVFQEESTGRSVVRNIAIDKNIPKAETCVSTPNFHASVDTIAPHFTSQMMTCTQTAHFKLSFRPPSFSQALRNPNNNLLSRLCSVNSQSSLFELLDLLKVDLESPAMQSIRRSLMSELSRGLRESENCELFSRPLPALVTFSSGTEGKRDYHYLKSKWDFEEDKRLCKALQNIAFEKSAVDALKCGAMEIAGWRRWILFFMLKKLRDFVQQDLSVPQSTTNSSSDRTPHDLCSSSQAGRPIKAIRPEELLDAIVLRSSF